MSRVYEGERIHIEIRPLASGQVNRLIVTFSANTVTDASAGGVNAALTALAELHGEIYVAIDALMSVRHHLDGAGGSGG